MSKILKYMVLTVLGITLVGCGSTAKEIKMKSQSGRTDVFDEVKGEGIPPKGFVDIIIKSSIKTHLEKHYLIEPKGTSHGKPLYPVVINIDGQAAFWNVEGQIEDAPEYAEEDKINPESGKGMRYMLIKRIRLAAGSHKIFFGLPGDNYFKEFTITVEDGKVYNLGVKPVYNRYRYEGQRFERGVDRIEVLLNGIPIK